MIKKLGLLLLVIFIVLGVIELALRSIGLGRPPLFEASEDYGYRLLPEQNLRRLTNRIYINEYGMRSEPLQIFDDPSRLRILIIGDSLSYGGETIDQEETYPYRLRDILSPGYVRNIEVLNASAPSWSIGNEIEFVRKYGFFDSDIVILQIGAGDLYASASSGDIVGESITHPDRAYYSAIQEVVTRLLPKSYITGKKQKDDHDRAPGAVVIDNALLLEDIAGMAKSSGAYFMAVYVPDKSEVDSGKVRYHHQITLWSDFFSRKEIPFLVSLRYFMNNRQKDLFYDGTHLTAEGNDVLAGFLYEALKDAVERGKLNLLNDI